MPMDPELAALLKQCGVAGPPPAAPPTVAEFGGLLDTSSAKP